MGIEGGNPFRSKGMKFNLLGSTTQINSRTGKQFGTGTIKGLEQLASFMVECGIDGDIYDLPNLSRNSRIASPFSINSGFAFTTDDLDFFAVPEVDRHPSLKSHLLSIYETNQRVFGDTRVVSYTLKRSIAPWILESCFEIFRDTDDEQRRTDFESFQKLAVYWLEHYAVHQVAKESEVDLLTAGDSRDLQTLTSELKVQQPERIAFHRYVQFLCFEQRRALHRSLKRMGIGLILNLPFGVELDSADVCFHPEVFDTKMQVGCSPEPEHGYPEQAWGVAAYREQTDGLRQYLRERMSWLAKFGDGVFLDHLVGWCGQYVVPFQLPADSVYPHGHFLTEDVDKRVENLTWFLEIVKSTGLKINGEVAGDSARVKASKEAIRRFIADGGNVNAMAIPRWEKDGELLRPLRDYQQQDLVMVETHDTSTLLQYLINQKGYEPDFESEASILEFCQRVLALPFFISDIPLRLTDCDDKVWFEICRRLSEGCAANEFVVSLPGLISLLSADFRSPTIENNINIKPGTSGTVGNGWRNWSYFSPSIECMVEDAALKSKLMRLGKRVYKPFAPMTPVQTAETREVGLEMLCSNPVNREIVFWNDNRWTVLNKIEGLPLSKVDLELVLKNTGDTELWHRIDLSGLLDLNGNDLFQFQDLNGNRECYAYDARDLKLNRFFVRLQPSQIHHFLIYRSEQPVALDL